VTTYPLPTLAATIDENGITTPAYGDILGSIIAQVQGIYGSDLYIDPDSQDGQFLAIFAVAQNNTNDSTVAAYQAYSPTTAQGAGLSSVVKINGLRRLVPSNSTVVLTLVGQAGLPIAIQNGTVLVGDNAGLGTQWAVEAVEIPLSGSVSATATCLTQGAVGAAPGTLINILTPIPGWQTVTNPAAAVLGQPVEADSALRVRQSVSTSQPAISPLDSILAAIRNLPTVGRAEAYENDTGITNSDGIPAHSIAVVVEGGSVSQIAQTIAADKVPGGGTYGTTSVVVVDPLGIPNTINFFALSSIEIFAIITITPLAGYITPTGTMLQNAVVAFLGGLSIGEDSYLNRLWSPVNLSGDAATNSSGQTQVALDLLSATYNPISIVQARADMVTIGGPYAAGVTTVSIGRVTEISIGTGIAITMDNTTTFPAVVTGIAGDAVTFTPGIPAGRTVQTGALVYVIGDLDIAFNEAALCVANNIQVLLT
jgi:uncharacterized phage protein gp47/JayE